MSKNLIPLVILLFTLLYIFGACILIYSLPYYVHSDTLYI